MTKILAIEFQYYILLTTTETPVVCTITLSNEEFQYYILLTTTETGGFGESHVLMNKVSILHSSNNY